MKEITVKVQIQELGDKCSLYCSFLTWVCGWKCMLFERKLNHDNYIPFRCNQCKEAK